MLCRAQGTHALAPPPLEDLQSSVMTEPTRRATATVTAAATSAEALAITSLVLASITLLNANPLFGIVGENFATDAKHFVGALIIGLVAVGLGAAAVGRSPVRWIVGAAGAATLLSVITIVVTFISWVSST